MPLRLIKLLLFLKIIQLAIHQRWTEQLTYLVNNLDLIIEPTHCIIIRLGLQEIEQLKLFIEIFSTPRKINSIVPQVDDLDIEEFLQDLKLRLVGEQPADHVVDGFLELADKGVGAWRQVHVEVADLARKGVAAVEVLLWDGAVEEDQVWVDRFSEILV